MPDRINGADVTNRGCRDKACQGVFWWCFSRLRQAQNRPSALSVSIKSKRALAF
jgi:hypothetical protein